MNKDFERLVRSGDVINQWATSDDGIGWLRRQYMKLSRWGIWWRQRELFGSKGETGHIHTMQWFDDGCFSCEPPVAGFFPLDHFISTNFIVYRYVENELRPTDIRLMRDSAGSFIGQSYDFGQIMDIALNHVLRRDNKLRYRWFDFGSRQAICSSAVRTNFEYMIGKTDRKPLFDELSSDFWSDKDIDRSLRLKSEVGYVTDIDMTMPAHFANSYLYNGCRFKPIAIFRDGRLVWESKI